MNIDNFITNIKSIEKLTKEMTRIESNEWEIKFIDDKDQSKWAKVYLNSEYHGRENPILFRLPKPTQSELIQILLKLNNLNQISGVACLIKDSEFDEFDNHNEYREKLIIELERIVNDESFKLTKFEKKRLITIVNDSDLNLPYNQRDSLGKKYDEVENDYLYYKNITERAEKLIAITGNNYSSLWQRVKTMFNLYII